MRTITAIYEDLQGKQSPMHLSLINTRVMLETGVNLRSVAAGQDRDPNAVAKVAAVLRDMGIVS